MPARTCYSKKSIACALRCVKNDPYSSSIDLQNPRARFDVIGRKRGPHRVGDLGMPIVCEHETALLLGPAERLAQPLGQLAKK